MANVHVRSEGVKSVVYVRNTGTHDVGFGISLHYLSINTCVQVVECKPRQTRERPQLWLRYVTYRFRVSKVRSQHHTTMMPTNRK